MTEMLENGDLNLVVSNPNFSQNKLFDIEEKKNENNLYYTEDFEKKKIKSEYEPLSKDPSNNVSIDEGHDDLKNKMKSDIKVKEYGTKENNEIMSFIDKENYTPLTTQKTLMQRTKNGIEAQIIDPVKYKNFMIKLVVDQYDPKNPEECQHIIFQSMKTIQFISTSKRKTNKKNINNSQSDSKSLKSSSMSESGISNEFNLTGDKVIKIKKYEYETIVMLEDFSVKKVNYLVEGDSVPEEESITFENIFQFSEMKFNVQNFSAMFESTNKKRQSVFGQNSNSIDEEHKNFSSISSTKLMNISNYVKQNVTIIGFISGINTINEKNINIVLEKKEKFISKVQVPIPITWDISRHEEFKIEIFQNDSSQFKDILRIIFYSQIHLAIFEFSFSAKKFIYHKMIERGMFSKQPVCFSKKRNLFYIPSKNKVQIYDDRLEFGVDEIFFEKEIVFICINDSKNLLLVSDSYFYYEIDLENLNVLRKEPCCNSQKDQFFFLMSVQNFPIEKVIQIQFHYSSKKCLRVLGSREKLELMNFPFESLIGCFGNMNKRESIKEFAKYYFERLKTDKRQDYEFGSMSPLIFCIYYLDSSLLEELLQTYFYPSRVFNYVSPIEYSFVRNHKASINEVCDAFLKKDEQIHLSRHDFKYLLASPLKICHKVVSTILQDPKVKSIPKLTFMEKPVVMRSSDFIISMGIKIMREDKEKEKIISDRILENRYKKKSKGSKYYNSDTNNESKTEVTVSSSTFKYNFDMGTDDSIMLIDRFAHTNCDDFVLSDWKYIIKKKWAKIKLPYVFIALLYFIFMIFVTLFISFRFENNIMRSIVLILNFLFILFELLKMSAYISYKPIIYFSDFFVYVELLVHIGTIVYFFLMDEDSDKIEWKIFAFVFLLFMYYRGLLFLQIFDAFTALVGIINTIIKELLVFFAIMFYAYFMIVILVMNVDSNQDIYLKFRDVYYWILLGGVDDDAFGDKEKIFLAALLIGSLFVTIILLNILIAYLSNLFSRLEDQQRVSDLKKKALLVLDIETMVRFFKYRITGITNLERKVEAIQDKEMEENKEIPLETQFKERDLEKLKNYFRNEKNIFIFKSSAREEREESENENAYQKLKNLEKSQEQISSLILLKTRMLEKDILLLKEQVKKNQNSQGKVIEELRDSVNGGIIELKEVMEDLDEKTEANKKTYMDEFKEVKGIKDEIIETNKNLGGNQEFLTEIKDMLKKKK